ncbi:hypothetical protein [Arthrobacter sp. AZCC_0090]|uniref:hypothetical protein n=1 Tax=Arthrobacter sp. AZCC_0090 TaxID=2735881 RepID=UPI0016164DF5|nr:hypothetical protein [Arthrobacter sp. AZCC_0090]MBB6402871.1 hypothetical protein [Arthrobacter sp. AZCC_0090]
MALSHFERFLAEATTPDPDATHILGQDQLYGLYLSWCLLGNSAPASESEFRAALKEHRIRVPAPGLRGTGPAATDYILATYPALP